MEENKPTENVVSNTNQTVKTPTGARKTVAKKVLPTTATPTSSPTRPSRVRNVVAKKPVATQPVATPRRPARVRKPIVNTAVEKAAISETVIAEVIVVESTLENDETKSLMDQVFKKIQKNEVKKPNNMSKKLTDKEKNEKAKKKAIAEVDVLNF